MWKLFDWFSSSAKKEEQARLNSLPATRRHLEPGKSHSVQVGSGSPEMVALREAMEATEDYSSPDASNNIEAILRSSSTAKLDSVLSNASARDKVSRPRAADARKDAMAYWRRNTRRERPTDSQFSSQFANSRENWSPYTVDATATSARTRFDQTISQDISKLGSALSDSTRAYFSNSYGQKGQAVVESRTNKDDYQRPTVESYPHYQGGWQPDHLQDDQPLEQPQGQTGLGATLENPAASFVPDEATQTIFDDIEAIKAMTDAPALPPELVSSLISVESSPQCDELFQQSAETYIEAQAPSLEFQPETTMLPPQFLSDTEAQQSTTLDRMPATQIIDVRIAAADHPDTPRETLLSLARDPNPDVRFAIAENHNADFEILKLLSDDENPFVASRARKTLQRLEGGQCRQGNFGSYRNSDRVRRAK